MAQITRRIVLIFLTFILISACSKPPAESSSSETKALKPLSDFPTIQGKVDYLISEMTLDEKIGQMIQVSKGALHSSEDIRTYYLGSLLSGGGESPSVNSPSAWADMVDAYVQKSMTTRLKIPLLYGIDAVHGHNNAYGAVIFPHNIGMGATRDTNLVERAAAVTAAEMAGTGIRWTFAPCIAVARDERWGRTYESYGEDPDLVSEMGASAVRGFQGTNLADPSSVLACAKHYAGDGGTAGGVNEGNTVLSEADFRAIHLKPYLSALSNSAGSVMVSFSSWNGTKMHANHFLVTDILKNELNFQGLVVSDWDAIGKLTGSFPDQVTASVNAGIDLFMLSGISYTNFFYALRNLVNSGTVPQSRIDDAVRRILTVKFNMGLFDHPYSDRSFTDGVGSSAHRAVAREAVRKSLVLLKNTNSILPLSKTNHHIVMTGHLANDLGGQCGGWTMTWQGSLGNSTVGTTIYQAVGNAVSGSSTVSYSASGNAPMGSDIGIAVIGEDPYAEGFGDDADLSLAAQDVQAVSNLKSAGIPVIVILISGRPLIVTSEIDNWDAFIAAWLPGTEGAGVADVLFGDYAPTGKLPCTWPRSISQIPINNGDGKTDPLFPYGYGLTY